VAVRVPNCTGHDVTEVMRHSLFSPPSLSPDLKGTHAHLGEQAKFRKDPSAPAARALFTQPHELEASAVDLFENLMRTDKGGASMTTELKPSIYILSTFFAKWPISLSQYIRLY